MNYYLRIELYSHNNYINIPDHIRTNVTNVNLHLHKAMKEVASKMPGWKYLDRCEAAISTENEEKQIRHCDNHCNSAFIDFHDSHSTTIEKLTIEEWKQFAKLIELEI